MLKLSHTRSSLVQCKYRRKGFDIVDGSRSQLCKMAFVFFHVKPKWGEVEWIIVKRLKTRVM